MANVKASPRPTFTKDQLDKYFEYIGLDEAPSQIPIKPLEQLVFLTKLLRYQLCKIPFENLDLHYSVVKSVCIDPTHVFHRVVEQRAGRGGYCMQLNNFFAQVLRSLGYTIVTLGGRVSTAAGFDEAASKLGPEEITFGGFGHQITLVVIEGKKYFCDVGFGNAGPTFPIPLENGFTQVNTGIDSQIGTTMKMVRGHIPDTTGREPEQMVWQYCVKYGKGNDESKLWLPMYCFSETEFLPADFDRLNYFVSTDKQSVFLQHIVCSKFLMSDDKQHLIGDITLSDTKMKERKYGKSHTLADIESEKDRTDALEQHMGVLLVDTEKAGIAGLPTMIR